jgi:hypothetical protein
VVDDNNKTNKQAANITTIPTQEEDDTAAQWTAMAATVDRQYASSWHSHLIESRDVDWREWQYWGTLLRLQDEGEQALLPPAATPASSQPTTSEQRHNAELGFAATIHRFQWESPSSEDR